MQDHLVSFFLCRLQSQDYRLALERSRDSKDTTFIHPLIPENEQRFFRVLKLASGAELHECMLCKI